MANDSEIGSATAETARQDRDQKGLFQPGNQIGRGNSRPRNKLKRLQADYRDVLIDEISLERWREIIHAAYMDAVSGATAADRAAARNWLSSYLLGRPKESIAISTDPADAPPIRVIAFDYMASISALAPLGPDGQPMPSPWLGQPARDILPEEIDDGTSYP